MFDAKTIYSILNESGENTSISLDKLIADILQELLPDVHAWVQITYDNVSANCPNLGRRQKGNMVRQLAKNKVEKNPMHQEIIAKYLGM